MHWRHTAFLSATARSQSSLSRRRHWPGMALLGLKSSTSGMINLPEDESASLSE
jgi:hypothetical protein